MHEENRKSTCGNGDARIENDRTEPMIPESDGSVQPERDPLNRDLPHHKMEDTQLTLSQDEEIEYKETSPCLQCVAMMKKRELLISSIGLITFGLGIVLIVIGVVLIGNACSQVSFQIIISNQLESLF